MEFWEKEYEPVLKTGEMQIIDIKASYYKSKNLNVSIKTEFFEKGKSYASHSEFFAQNPAKKEGCLWMNLKRLSEWMPWVFEGKDLRAMKDGMMAENADLTPDSLNRLYSKALGSTGVTIFLDKGETGTNEEHYLKIKGPWKKNTIAASMIEEIPF